MSDINQIKCVFLGDSGVGKTCMLHRFINGTFITPTSPTIGGSYLSKVVTYESRKIDLMLWDTAGQEMYRGLAPMYYRNAKIAFIVFDITSQKSFESVKFWVEELRQNTGNDIIIVIVGNKCDLEQMKVVDTDKAEAYTKSVGATYIETSAMSGYGIDHLFETGVSLVMKNAYKVIKPSVDIEPKKEEKKQSGCC